MNSTFTNLRERDWSALIELFERDDSDDIVADVINSLQWLVPEPLWEDNTLDFLKEFLVS